MIKHILKRLSILNTYNTHVFDLVQFVKPRSIMNFCVSKHLTTAFNLWLFCPTLIKSGQLLGLFGRVGTCTRVHTYLGGGGSRPGCKYSTVCLSVTSCNVYRTVLIAQVFLRTALSCCQNLPCVPYYLVLISVEHCTEITLRKLGHTSSIISWFLNSTTLL